MPPVTAPITGMITSPTSEFTIPEKAAPIITPTARSTTLPRSANFLNSSSMTVHLAAHDPPGRGFQPWLISPLVDQPGRHHRQPHRVGTLADKRHRILDRGRTGFHEQIDV